MPKPGDIHTNKPLQNIVIANLQKQSEFTFPQAVPFVPVDKESDLFYKFTVGDMFMDVTKERAAGTESQGVDWTVSTDTFICKEWSLHHDVPDRVRGNDDVGLTEDTATSMFLTQFNLIKLDRLMVEYFFKASTWTGSSTGSDIVPSTKWDASSSTPVEDVQAQARSMKQKTGYKPNTLMVTSDVHIALKNNADITGRLSSNERAILNHTDMANIFEVDKYIVNDSIYNSAAKGATASMAFTFGTASALLWYANPNPTKFSPSAAYCFANKNWGGNDWGLRMKKFRMEELESDRLEQSFMLIPKLISADLGVFFATVMT